MRRTSQILLLVAGVGLAGLAGAGCSMMGAQPSDQTASNGYYRGAIGNGAFGEAVPASDREQGNSARMGPGAGASPDHGFVGNGAFGEAP